MLARNLLLASALVTLASCSSGSDMRETLGLNRQAPDEFRVYARPALTVPPDFSLRPPGTVTDAPTTVHADAQAHNTVLSESRTTSTSAATVPVATADIPSGADAQFLQNAGAMKANPQVRSSIQNEVENGISKSDSHYLVNLTSEGDPTVDATKEAERLKENKAQNKPVTAGDTPVEEPKSKSIWGAIGDIF